MGSSTSVSFTLVPLAIIAGSRTPRAMVIVTRMRQPCFANSAKIIMTRLLERCASFSIYYGSESFFFFISKLSSRSASRKIIPSSAKFAIWSFQLKSGWKITKRSTIERNPRTTSMVTCTLITLASRGFRLVLGEWCGNNNPPVLFESPARSRAGG